MGQSVPHVKKAEAPKPVAIDPNSATLALMRQAGGLQAQRGASLLGATQAGGNATPAAGSIGSKVLLGS